MLAVGRDRRFRIVTGRLRERLYICAVRIGGVDIIIFVNRPDITFRIIWRRRTFWVAGVSRGEEDPFSVWEEIAASCSPFARADQLHIAAVGIHGENLIALVVSMRRLEGELFAVT